MKNIISCIAIACTIAVAPNIAMSQSAEGVSQPISLSIAKAVAPSSNNYESYIKRYVEKSINKWQIKDEFETTAAYKARVNETSRRAKAAELANEAQAKWMIEVSRNTGITTTLKPYDADNETFLINTLEYGDILVKVPMAEAKAFRDNWSSIKKDNAKYQVIDKKLSLKALTFITPAGKSYTYNSQVAGTYASADVNFTFDPIDVSGELASTSNSKAKQNISSQKINIGAKKSDVDSNIPVSTASNSNTFVLLLANEDYMREKAIPTAKQDARSVREYCKKTLGIPEANIRSEEDCTYKMMESSIENFAYTMRVNPGAKFMVFYFGHGMADPNATVQDSYFLPIDGSSLQIARDGISRNKMLKTFAAENPKQCIVFLESCFSGVDPSNEMLAYATNTSGVRIKEKSEPVNGNIVVLSASAAAQTAFAFPQEGHNLFTYQFLKTLKESAGDITLGSLYDKVRLSTAQTANNKLNGAKQTPTVMTSTSLADSWKEWKLK